MKHYLTDLRSKLATAEKCPSMMRGGIGQIPHRKKDNKGFTLVELIVVIVILAILAALLIPGLLQWIDKAKEEQYGLDARNVYLATEAWIAEQYAAGEEAMGTTLSDVSAEGLKYIQDLSGLGTNLNSVQIKTAGDDATKESWKIKGMEIKFTPSNGGTSKIGTMDPNNAWTFKDPTP